MAENEIAVLKKELLTQQQLLQKVYMELEKEREASSTAANEALSMILRLQGERAAEKMEASQYKRMAEEKMYHAEESLVVFEDLMYQKDREIASLEFEVQAYRHKLLSLGFSDGCVRKMRFPDNQFLQRDEVHFGNFDFHGTVRRNNSLPTIQHKNSDFRKGIIGREDSKIPLEELMPRKKDGDWDCKLGVQCEYMLEETEAGDFDSCWEQIKRLDERVKVLTNSEDVDRVIDSDLVSEESEAGDFNSYWEQIKQLDERVKVVTNSKDVDRVVEYDSVSSNHDLPSTMATSEKMKGGCRSCSLHSAVSKDLSYYPTSGAKGVKLGPEGTFYCSSSQSEAPDNSLEFDASSIPCLETETIKSTIPSTSVHDIFEVPQNNEDYKFCGSQKQEQTKLIFEGDSLLENLDSVPQETAGYYFKDEAEWVKKVLLYAHHESKIPKPRDGVPVDCHLAFGDPTIGLAPSQAEIQQLAKRLELLENDRRIMKEEASGRGEEELKLLREIHEQLSKVQSVIKSSKVKKSPPLDESQLSSVMEAMLYFSL